MYPYREDDNLDLIIATLLPSPGYDSEQPSTSGKVPAIQNRMAWTCSKPNIPA